MKKDKTEVVSFKADPALLEAMAGIGNRSEFIRSAILAALDGTCPLCQGTGILTPHQREHWAKFSRDHKVRQCERCQANYLECLHDSTSSRTGH